MSRITEICPIDCPQSCADLLPKVKFDDCVPDLNYGEIEWLYLGRYGYPFQDWTTASEWAARLVPSGRTPNKHDSIISLRGIGSRPKPQENIITISGGRKVALPSVVTLNFSMDETNAENHLALRMLQCDSFNNLAMWYETRDGQFHGGNNGIRCFVDPDYIIPEDFNQLIKWETQLVWDATHTECRTKNNFIVHTVDPDDECYLLAQSGIPVLTQDGKYLIIC